MARAFIVWLLLLAPAYADSLRDEAHLHYEIGRIAYEKHQWADAVAEFKKAYAIVPIPDLIYNIGRCQEQLGQPAEALASYRVYLATLTSDADRETLSAHIAQLESVQQAAPSPAPVVAPAVAQKKTESSRDARPVSRRWWLWTSVGVVVVGVALGVGLGVGLSQSSGPSLGFPGVTAR